MLLGITGSILSDPMAAIELLLELLFFPAMVICILLGIGVAALLHWFFPSVPIEVEAFFVALGFLAGFLLSWSEKKHENR